MDRIERVEDSTDNGVRASPRPPSQEAFPDLDDTDPQPPATTTRTPRLRRQSRQPSIRLRRLSSASSFGQQETTAGTEHAPQPTEQQSSGPAATDLEDSWSANRRRSNSEPRPGRYSAPPLIITSGMQRSSQHPMSPVTEETGRPSTDLHNIERFAALNALPTNATERSSNGWEGASAQGQVPIQESPERPGMLRRASNVALSALGRNRAATMTAPNPAARNLAPDEYDSRIVDLLDVIGKSDATSIDYTLRCSGKLMVP